MTNRKIRTIDLFCGAGGSSYGAAQAGADILAGFDIWDKAIRTFNTNFPGAKVFQGDLREYTPRDINNIKSSIGEVDLIIASPECTNHSRAKGSAERSEASKETAFEVVRFAKEIRPRWIIVENVVEFQYWNRFKVCGN
jgi:DNA (cytosine-5)-methyltransferase 1